MLKASGVVLPAIKEAHNEGANTPEVAKGGNGSPRTGLRATKSPSKPGSALAPKAACLPEQLRGLMRVWGERGQRGGSNCDGGTSPIIGSLHAQTKIQIWVLD